MSDVKYPIALLNGKRVHINQFNTTQKGVIFFCPKCNERLVANISFKKTKNSNWTINRKNYFSHHNSDSLCPGGGESEYHKLAAELFEKEKYIYVPTKDDKVIKVIFDRVDIKKLKIILDGELYKCDAKGIRDSKKDILIEFYYTHKSEDKKVNAYKKNHIQSLEVDISEIDNKKSCEIVDYILINSPREWIFHPPSKITSISEVSEEEGYTFLELFEDLISTGKKVYHFGQDIYYTINPKKKKKWWEKW